MKETWRAVPDWEGLYEASDCGRIRRVKRYDTRLRRLKLNKSGYFVTCLYAPMQRKDLFVHRVIARTFLGPLPKGHQVDHKDGRKTNNHVSNLEYVTPSENTLRAHRIGLKVNPVGTAHPNSKLTDALVREIRTSPEQGKKIAARLRVSCATISLVRSRRVWKHIE